MKSYMVLTMVDNLSRKNLDAEEAMTFAKECDIRGYKSEISDDDGLKYIYHGDRLIDVDAAYQTADEELMGKIHYDGLYETEQEFFQLYCTYHKNRYHEDYMIP